MRLTATFLYLLFALASASCQNKSNHEAPQVVLDAFELKYPGENDPDFEQDVHGYWEAHFKKGGEKYRADFHADGTWRETENSIKDKEIPEAIQKAIQREFPNLKIAEAEHVISATKGEFYDIEFKQKGKNKDVEYRRDGSKV
ncbi:hypothetical protein F0365_14445 [Nonlabens sp. Ci31]|jgi:hypothetical protein|uniref:PepSY-like domain-containing protein n=1 Tax=Nonlabens sp. Ci31 TaxID=2608253 RepID=UPI00146297B7|nr:PepSY-like domain-containing protein [Nonlabens sp. Ci31]QJP35512.1 hypothetical protein F0365_14445 [Nonlabens sp. Ci31]